MEPLIDRSRIERLVRTTLAELGDKRTPSDRDDGESGLLVPSGDSDGLAAALRRIAGAPELRARLGTAARRRVESEFSAVSSTERVMAVYEGLLRGRPDRP